MAIVITSSCNLICTYCINNSGSLLLPEGSSRKEWSSSKEIVAALKKISQVRKIKFIKFFGGEPMLRYDLIQEIVSRKNEFSSDGKNRVRFAFTTNAYYQMTEKMVSFFKENRFIVNVSLDGTIEINNKYRIAMDGKDVYSRVVKNLNILKNSGVPFALISVLDERIIEYGLSIRDLANFLSSFTPIYKIEPAYIISENPRHNDKPNNESILKRILQLEVEFIDQLFFSIINLDINGFSFENNFLRTLSNVLYKREKKHICSASSLIALLPDNSSYSCYNLIDEKYKISENFSKETPKSLDKRLAELENILSINRFPHEYKSIEEFGDYCPKEANFDSFAYSYRKTMIETIYRNLNKIIPGSKEHLSLLGYLNKGYGEAFYDGL